MPPTLTYPRDDKVKPTTSTGLSNPGALQLRSQKGVRNFRSTVAAMRTWSETYDMVKATDPVVRNWLAFLRRAWNQGLTFNIKHLHTPGSGEPPNGTGSSGVTVSGGSQTGETITTTGWPVSTNNVVRAGDLIRINGIGAVREVFADANSDSGGNATLSINPPIFTGNSPADGASVITSDVDIWASISAAPNIPETTNSFYYSSIEIKFAEVANA